MEYELNTANEVTDHAIDMWNKRTGCTDRKRTKAAKQILGHIAGAKHIAKQRWYANGWIFVVSNQKVVTCYRPKTLVVMNEVYLAHACQK